MELEVAAYLDGFTERDIKTLAGIVGTEPATLADELRRRPWAIHDVLGDEAVVDGVMGRYAHPANVVSPFLLFAVIVHGAAAELQAATYVNDWTGPRSRLPVFDVAPLQEFLEDPARVFFLASLLESFALPVPVAAPANPFSLDDIALWVDQAVPAQRASLLVRLGDLSLFESGIFPDHTGSRPLTPAIAERLGSTVDMTAAEVLELCDTGSISPGLDALESLGSRWYETAVAEGSAPKLLGDVAARFRAARRVLNYVADAYLYPVAFDWDFAA
jgi:hypothetical protein